MIGAIQKKHILAHMIVTIRCFGWRVFLNSIFAGRQKTFLSMLSEAHPLPPEGLPSAEIIGRCIKLELCAMRIYSTLSIRFKNLPRMKLFMETLAKQEETHAELLGICQKLAGCGEWQEKSISVWEEVIDSAEKQMQKWELDIGHYENTSAALQLVVAMEATEINNIFMAVIRSTESEFVRAVEVFGRATHEHISYICEEIPQIMPDMADYSSDLARHFGFIEEKSKP